MNIRIAGFGGQGIVMAGYLVGHAAILDGRKALQTQSYGSESRGGACKSDVIISEDDILDLAVSDLDVLVAMSQPAFDKYAAALKTGGTLVYDSDLVQPGGKDATGHRASGAGDGGIHLFGLPAADIAQKIFGRNVVANVILVGCLVAVTGIASAASMRKVISQSAPGGTEEMNLQAFDEGFKRGAAQEPHNASQA